MASQEQVLPWRWLQRSSVLSSVWYNRSFISTLQHCVPNWPDPHPHTCACWFAQSALALFLVSVSRLPNHLDPLQCYHCTTVPTATTTFNLCLCLLSHVAHELLVFRLQIVGRLEPQDFVGGKCGLGLNFCGPLPKPNQTAGPSSQLTMIHFVDNVDWTNFC